MEELKLISITNLLDKEFVIPPYQRGYRWNERQVLDLLEDILEFQEKHKGIGEFYCLQPIVVRKYGENGNKFEVIDGQQRLTTIYIILKYLEEVRKIILSDIALYRIRYETREKEGKSSKHFLENINNIAEKDKSNIDFYYISSAYFTIKNWFETKKVNKADFLNTLLKRKLTEENGKEIDVANNVRFIWYEIKNDKENPIDIFTRINMGKIPLTNAELIKALFFLNEDSAKKEKLQWEIGYEWDNIEYALHNETFWYFLNRKKDDKMARIEFIFDLIADKYKSKLENFSVNKSIDKYYTFYIFNELIKRGIKSKKMLWDEIKTYFRIFEEWYENNEYYHLIGYLVHTQKGVIMDILNKAENLTKSDFKGHLIEKIRKGFRFDNLMEMHYGTNNIELKKVLLLFNVITAMKSNYSKFPFEKYIGGKWSLEHIHAQNSEELRTPKQRKLLLNDQKEFFSREGDKKLVKKIEGLLEEKNIPEDRFSELQDEIFSRYSDEINIHTIDNLALLAKDNNSALNNNIFPAKRDRIIYMDKKGDFIPIGTKNVFLKYYSKNVEQNVKWEKSDRKAYLSAIEETLADYLPKKGKK